MQRAFGLLLLGFFLVQVGTGCCRMRAHRMAHSPRLHAMDCGCAVGTAACSTCEASPIAAGVSFGTPIAAPVTPVLTNPVPVGGGAADVPTRMPNLSYNPASLGRPVK